MHTIKVSTALCLIGVVSAFPFVKRQNSCGTKDFNGKLQFAIIPEGAGSGKQAQPTQIGDGQVQAPPVTQISDGQVQAPHVSQIPDGQVQAPHVSQIPDGQVQAPHVSQIPDGQVQAPHVSQIPDGQVQAPHVSQIPDGQVQAPQPSQIHDGQVQAPAGAAASGSGGGACNSNGLVLTLKNGQLFDQQGRYGYIASNSQFQFDNPVQAGGYGQNDWTLCGNNTLANAGKTTFYKCDSGSGFYNLYNMDYNPGACSAVHFLVSACS